MPPRNAKPLTVWVPRDLFERFVVKVQEELPARPCGNGDGRVPDTVRELLRAYVDGVLFVDREAS